MRLIDADDLKEDMKSRLSYCNEWIEKAKDKETKIRASAVKSFIAEVIMTIDNASTVEQEVYMTGEDYDLYMRGYKQARKDFGRPQDEFTLKELRRWLIAQGYSEGTVDDKIEDFGRFVKQVREDEG